MRRFIAWKQAVINRLIHKPWIVAVRQTPAEPAFNPASMFTPTTPGWVYDLSDFSTLFQDSAGTTPVTAVEQPVGLVKDKSQGLVLGPELTQDAATWTGSANWTVDVPNARATLVNATSGDDDLTLGTLTGDFVGQMFKVSMRVESVTGSVFVTGSRAAGPASAFSSPGDYEYFLRITITGVGSLSVNIAASGNSCVVSNISVRELPGNHASQPTSTKRPVLKVDGSGNYYLKGDGVDDFMSTAAIDFTGADAVTLWQGVQKLSDTESGVLCELGAESITLNGTFGLFAPEPSGTGYMFNSRGTSRAFVISPSRPAPHKCVLTAQGRISTDTCAIMINKDVVMTNAADQGINAYTLNPMYFGARGGTSNFFGGQQYSSVGIGKPNVTPEELDNTRTWINDRTGAY